MGDGELKSAPIPWLGTNARSAVPPLLSWLEINLKPRRCCDGGEYASLTQTGYDQVEVYTLCPDNGGSSGSGYFPLTKSGFRLAARRSIQLWRTYRDCTIPRLSGTSCQRLLFLVNAFRSYFILLGKSLPQGGRICQQRNSPKTVLN